MADNVTTGSTGIIIAADNVTDGTLGSSVLVQYVKLMDGTIDGTNKVTVTSGGNLSVLQSTNTTFAYSAAGTFRSTTSGSTYAAGDVYGASPGTAAVQFSLGAPSGRQIMITSATYEIDTSATEATAWTLQLYNVTPPSATADNGAWDLPSGDRASWLGQISLGTPSDLGSTLWSESHGINKQLLLAGTSVFGYLTNVSSSTAITTADHIVTLYAVGV